jgi:hypothetical protein
MARARKFPDRPVLRLMAVRAITTNCRVLSVVQLQKIVYLSICLMPLKLQNRQARSSAGEHFLDAEGVGGSIPPVPTSIAKAVPPQSPILVSS